MTLAVMQPYFFPYLGYYQLVNAVDLFIFFDDVNFINKGWINRNNILVKDKPQRFTLPLSGASQNRLINEIEIADLEKFRKDFMKLIEYNYRKAPFYTTVSSWLQDFFSKDYRFVSEIAAASIRSIAEMLNLKTAFGYSSELNYKSTDTPSGQDKVLKICEMLKAQQYINPKNGTELYDPAKFSERGIRLKFINMDEIAYHQFEAINFVPYLSIIDVLMFNDKETVKQLLNKYTLN